MHTNVHVHMLWEREDAQFVLHTPAHGLIARTVQAQRTGMHYDKLESDAAAEVLASGRPEQ